MTLNARDFRVAIDTGSTDLWVVSSPDFAYDTAGSVPITINYGGGPVVGTSGFATMQLGDYQFTPQAFMNATSVGLSDIIDIGLDGLMGLSFTNNGASDLTKGLKSWGPTTGQPFHFNIFDARANEDNFIGISLSRTDDLETSADASFTFNEVDPKYPDILNTPRIPLFPGNNGRWSILVDILNNNGVESRSHLPSLVPRPAGCDNPYTMYPLDLSDVVFGTDDAGNNFTACVSTIFPLAASSEDALFGDTFMRNAYSIFNFGDTVAKTPTNDATMQLLSQTPDARTLIQELLSVRMARLATLPPEFQGFIPGYVPAPPGSVLPATPVPGTSASGSLAADASDSSPNGNSDSTVKQYALIVIGLLSGNLLVLLILAAVGVALYVKRSGSARAPNAKYVPVKFKEETRGLERYEEDRRCSD
ncbi:aspartic peptidase domain-containing protein [Mycena capillaripes]|nr:aspartic peptidase domain-containing protein [Mycena capillaripes]